RGRATASPPGARCPRPPAAACPWLPCRHGRAKPRRALHAIFIRLGGPAAYLSWMRWPAVLLLLCAAPAAAAPARSVTLVHALAAASCELADEVARVPRARFEAGDAARVEVVQSDAALRRARAEAAAAGTTIGAASAELAALVGWEVTAPLHAEGGLPAPAST